MTTPIPPNPPRWTPAVDPASIVVPGLDSNAPVNDQIDQIEQLITIKLQNIDANFSKIQNILSSRLLPAVKRYAVSTEPVRETAKFWTSFYEQAAQVHIPTLEDHYMNESQSQTPLSDDTPVPSDQTLTSAQSDADGPSQCGNTDSQVYDVTASESSFMPTNAVSSTPARGAHLHNRTIDDQPSWSASLESPLVRLDRELQNFTREEQEEVSAHQDATSTSDSFAYEEEDTVQQKIDIKGKSKEQVLVVPSGIFQKSSQPSNAHQSAIPTPRMPAVTTHVSPLKVKPKTPIPIPKHLQCYIPPKSQPEPVLPSPRHPKYQRSPRKLQFKPAASTSTSSSALDIPSLTKHSSEVDSQKKFEEFNDSFDDSVELMRGMSPPRTMAFARAPRSSMDLGLLPPGRTPAKNILPQLGRTPMKEAADRIRRDLLGDVHGQFSSARCIENMERLQISGYVQATTKDDTMSTIPTPPSLSRYTRHAYPSGTDDTDTSLETMMRRVGLKMPEPNSGPVSLTSGNNVFSQRSTDVKSLELPAIQHAMHTPDQHVSDVFHLHHDEQSVIDTRPRPRSRAHSDSDSDSLSDEPARPGQPSTAFLMASARDPDPDDSFASSSSNHSSDSLGAEQYDQGEMGSAPVHPFARAIDAGDGDGFDDSFDSVDGDDEGGNGARAGADEETVFGIPPAQRRQGARTRGELRMLGEDLLHDTIGIGSQLAKVGRVEESPTPFGRS
ncbi:hypothetical protein ID866_7802 [Astraeus odoratus]|nr:hypothetical protein ID866_7802 [Astraeus odoratus]